MIAVMTCARPGGASYIAATLDDVDSSAAGARVIIADRCVVPARAGWTSVEVSDRPAYARPRDNKWALWTALEFAARVDEDLIVLEDDVRLCQNAARYAERLRVPDDIAFVSLFSPWGDSTMPMGLWRSKLHVFMYAQALKFPLRTVRELVAARGEMADQLNKGGSDDMLQALGERRGWLYAAHYPSVAQHVGAVSAVTEMGLDGCRVSRAYRGDGFDAMTLPHQMYK